MLVSKLLRCHYKDLKARPPPINPPHPPPRKFLDRFETYKPEDDILDSPPLDKTSALGRNKLLQKEKTFSTSSQHTTATKRINRFVPVDRGCLDFQTLVLRQTNTFSDIHKLVLKSTQPLDAVNISTAMLQLSKASREGITESEQQECFAVLAQSALNIEYFPSRQTSNTVYALAMARFDFPLKQDMVSHLVKHRTDWNKWEPQHLSTLAWSLTKLRQTELTSELLGEIAKQSRLLGMRRFNTMDLSQLEFAFAKTPVLCNVQAFSLCSAICRNRGFPNFTNQNLLVLFRNYLLLKPGGERAFLNALCEELRTRRFTHVEEIVEVLECLAQVEKIVVEPLFLQSLCKRLVDVGLKKESKERLNTLAKSVVALQVRHTALLQEVSSSCKKKGVPLPPGFAELEREEDDEEPKKKEEKTTTV